MLRLLYLLQMRVCHMRWGNTKQNVYRAALCIDITTPTLNHFILCTGSITSRVSSFVEVTDIVAVHLHITSVIKSQTEYVQTIPLTQLYYCNGDEDILFYTYNSSQGRHSISREKYLSGPGFDYRFRLIFSLEILYYCIQIFVSLFYWSRCQCVSLLTMRSQVPFVTVFL